MPSANMSSHLFQENINNEPGISVPNKIQIRKKELDVIGAQIHNLFIGVFIAERILYHFNHNKLKNYPSISLVKPLLHNIQMNTLKACWVAWGTASFVKGAASLIDLCINNNHDDINFLISRCGLIISNIILSSISIVSQPLKYLLPKLTENLVVHKILNKSNYDMIFTRLTSLSALSIAGIESTLTTQYYDKKSLSKNILSDNVGYLSNYCSSVGLICSLLVPHTKITPMLSYGGWALSAPLASYKQYLTDKTVTPESKKLKKNYSNTQIGIIGSSSCLVTLYAIKKHNNIIACTASLVALSCKVTIACMNDERILQSWTEKIDHKKSPDTSFGQIL